MDAPTSTTPPKNKKKEFGFDFVFFRFQESPPIVPDNPCSHGQTWNPDTRPQHAQK
jgi:hypothetical protein